MNRKRILALLAAACFILLGYAAYFQLATVSITIFHTNDVHGNTLPAKDKQGREIGGAAALANLLSREKKPYLLLDAGDIFQGTPEGDLTRGDASIAVMNALGYDAATVGNHEYDLGEANFIRLTKAAKFPMLGANVYHKKTGARVKYLKPHWVKVILGIRLGIFGLITQTMPDMVFPSAIRGLEFRSEVEEAQSCVEELKSQGADVILALTHIGKDADEVLAEEVPGISAILGGHSHTRLEKPSVNGKNRTVIVQTGGRGTTVGKLRLRIHKRSKRVISARWQIIPLNISQVGEDFQVKALVGEFAKKVGKALEKEIGSASHDLLRGSGETLLGNWQTDVMRRAAAAEIAFQNSGGIRADLKAGKVTLRDIYVVAPFDNTLVTMNLTGAQIREILEFSLSGKAGSPLQVSGLKIHRGSHLEIWIGKEKLKEKRLYRVTTNNFVAAGGDGYKTFREGKNLTDTKKLLRDVFIEEIRKHSPISTKLEGRIP